MAMAAQPAPQLPLVTVTCTSCEHQFLSRARRHSVVRCPRCKHGVRVKRPLPAAGSPPPAASTAPPAPAPARAVSLLRPVLVPHGSMTGRPAAPAAQPRPAPAAASRLPGMTWAEALAALGWQLHRDSDRCQIRERRLACPDQPSHVLTIGRVCDRHYDGLVATITASLRQ